MSDTFLRPDGYVEWRPDPTTTARVVSAGHYVIPLGQLCTACLVGDWPQSSLRMSQTLCGTCHALESEVTRRAGLDDDVTAGRIVGGRPHVAGLDDPHGTDWEPVRQARAYRQGRLAGVFVRARALGVVILEEGRPGALPRELVAHDDLRRHGLIHGAMTDRVGRYAAWLQALDADGHARRAHVLADVDPLAAWLRHRERDVRRVRARRELDRAAREAARAPVALARSLTRVVTTGRRYH